MDYNIIYPIIINQNINALKKLLDNGLNINEASPYGLTLLMKSIVEEKYEITKFLLNNGADPNIIDRDGNNVLLLACKGYEDYVRSPGQNEIIKLIINKGVDVNHMNNEGKRALLLICENYNKSDIENEIIKLLIDKKSIMDDKNSDGNTPLLLLCKKYINSKKYTDIIKYVIDKGLVNINATNHNFENVLCLLCNYTFTDINILLYLIDNKNTNIQGNSLCLQKPLLNFYKKNNINMFILFIKELVKRDTYIDFSSVIYDNFLLDIIKDNDKSSIISETINLLVDNFIFRENQINKAIICACEKNFLYIVKILLKLNASTETINNNGETLY